MSNKLSHIVHSIEACMPFRLVSLYRETKNNCIRNLYRLKYSRKTKNVVKNPKPINVVFMAIHSSVWKYDELYKLMSSDSRFNPVVLICPQINVDEQVMWFQMQDALKYFLGKGYHAKSTYEEVRKEFIDLSELNPDILMYTNPYKGLIMDKYYIDNVKNVLTCYISYYYPKGISGYHKILEPFESKLWLNFIVNEEDYKNVTYKDNCRIVGYPMYEAFKFGKNEGVDWKIKKIRNKRIIWSPYHNINNADTVVQISTFTKYASFMLKIAEKYLQEIEIVFKPHPLLYAKLLNHPEWGKEKTDEYYNKWKNGVNTNLVEGEYVDLFTTSDAMIHDCGSFAVEYLYVDKPVMYLAYDEDYLNHIEPLGVEALDCHEIGFEEKDIEMFVKNIIDGNVDPKKEKRKAFIEKYLLPPNGLTASENMLNEIVKELKL